MNIPEQKRATRGGIIIQAFFGFCAWFAFVLPYMRRVQGMERLQPHKRYLFVANHVSLLDTILLGGLCWRSGCYPILVLGDKGVWEDTWVRRALSAPIGFLLERGKFNPKRIRELQTFGRSSANFHLVVYPEGTRGDGVNVAECQPGVYYIAQQARVPIVPIFFQNMQNISTKNGPCHPISGLRKVEVFFGEEIAPENYLHLPREEFLELVRRSIRGAQREQSAARWSPFPRRA